MSAILRRALASRTSALPASAYGAGPHEGRDRNRPVADFRFGSYSYARPLLRKLETSGHRNGLGGVRAVLLGLLDLLAFMQKRLGHSDLP